MLDEAGAAALDLDTAASFLLDVFDVGTAVADDLSTEVEARDGLEVHGDFLLWPFALKYWSVYSRSKEIHHLEHHYPSILITLDLLGLSAAEAPLVNKVGQFLLHKLVDFGDGLLKAFLGGTRDVEVERRNLRLC